ncbi:hypothetical protein Val02_70970 [Virgisporangium aliadipatigenens]|uniref:cysteine-S-conjugate beta-lyase n=1 Tax=Virgisporangium aliadipatigenens TaxID=741659 RepID=A0A8J3YUT9_9ACTN|nr:aminotransferase class I/II-fold pyridoxal phosphate-dependent enzyme [Virgisporangium aliadipatigenens]GIJ50211.1 hypothetical protein Val02_70970 [Virgisporangium aliadipatigenens]
MLTRDDYLYFADRALDGMTGIVAALGDERANRKPGANSPYALLTHCLGVVEAWAGGLVAGRPVDRDRAAEFTATGPIEPLLERARKVRAAFHADVHAARPEAPLNRRPPADFDGPDRELSQGAALLHVYEELAQHHGQMEILRDQILASETGPPQRLRAGIGAKWRDVEPDVLPSWVADMDLGVAPPILDRIHRILARQDLGYPFRPDDPVVAAFEGRMRDRYGWAPRAGRTKVLSDLLQILQIVIELTTRPGDGVALHVPAYPPFLASIRRAGRVVVPIQVPADVGRAKLLVLVNPQNPTGRVLTAEELSEFAMAAEEHDLVVLADEIHADLTYAPHRHIPFASLPGMATRTVTATSATKTFNIAGLRCAIAHIGPDALVQRLDALPIDYFGTPDILGRAATVAAWTEAGQWHRDLMVRLRANRDRVAAWAAERGLAHRIPEATYLSWIDFAGTRIADDPAGHILRDGRVRLSPGTEFGGDCGTFARINFATTPETLEEILAGVERALERR